MADLHLNLVCRSPRALQSVPSGPFLHSRVSLRMLCGMNGTRNGVADTSITDLESAVDDVCEF